MGAGMTELKTINIPVDYDLYANKSDIKVNHPDCEHPNEYRDIVEIGNGEKLKSVNFCTICKKVAIPDYADRTYSWEDILEYD